MEESDFYVKDDEGYNCRGKVYCDRCYKTFFYQYMSYYNFIEIKKAYIEHIKSAECNKLVLPSKLDDLTCW